MPDMLVVTALELSHPVLLVVLMEADDAALHGCSLVAEKRRLSGGLHPSAPASG
jgi:hypothetical protein